MTHHQRLLFRKWLRTLHIYLSMLGLLTLIFFSLTGIMLNHEEWFGFAEPRVRKTEGVIPAALLAEPDKLGIVEKLRRDFGATGALESFDVQGDRLEIIFKSPGRRTQVAIERPGGQTEATIETHGFAGRFAELHRGTDAGPGWRLVIDASAVLLLISGLTGLTLWLLVPKWRPLGLVAVAVSGGICLLIYFALVP